MDPSPSSSSVAKTPALVSTSSSGSIHNRLVVSSSSSARRLRLQSVVESDDEKLVDVVANTKSSDALQCLPSVPKSPTLPLYDTPKEPHRNRSILYRILLSYGVLSMAFLTSRLLGIPRQPYSNSPFAPSTSSISSLDDLSMSYRISKLLPLKPEVEAFIPFLTRSTTDLNVSDVTACIWVTEEEIHHLEKWATQWRGT